MLTENRRKDSSGTEAELFAFGTALGTSGLQRPATAMTPSPSATDSRTDGAAAFVPDTRSVAKLAAAAKGCRGCQLYEHAEQTVFGAGARTARMMLIGEQPGDQEEQGRQAVRRPCGPGPRQGAGRRGDRARRALRDERRQALQVHRQG